VAVVDAQQVVEDEHLAVGRGTGADADHRDLDPRHHGSRQLARHGLEHDREAARVLERESVLDHRHRAVGRAPLRAVAAQRRGRLRREAHVAHHRDAGVHDRLRALRHDAPALELDGIAAGLLDEALGRGDRLLVRGLIGAERQVADEQRRAQAAAGGAGEHQHLVDRDRHGARVAEYGHRAGVAHEHHVDAGGLGHLRAGVVVGRDHHDRLAERLLLDELGQRDGGPLGGRCGCAWRRAHDSSSATASSTVTIWLSAFTWTTFGS
jgi:hypothetical protein